MKHLGDICKINGKEVPIVDCVIGGSPCQDLSVAGARKGLQHSDLGSEETTRSGLFMEQIRIIKEMRENDRSNGRASFDVRPRWMVWENVVGALSSPGKGRSGEDFRAVLEECARVVDERVSIPKPNGKWKNAGTIIGNGYSIAWRVFNASEWGVPQRRRRICLVCDFNGYSAADIVFENVERERSTFDANTESPIGSIGEKPESEIQLIKYRLRWNPETCKSEREAIT